MSAFVSSPTPIAPKNQLVNRPTFSRSGGTFARPRRRRRCPDTRNYQGPLERRTTLQAAEFRSRARADRRSSRKPARPCHRLFGEGGDVGPELTGSQRANLDYVLENVLDPNALVASEYQVTVLTTKNGRVLAGIIKQEGDRAITIQSQNERITLPKDEIETREKLSISMMPEGLLDTLGPQEVCDLVAYLARAQPRSRCQPERNDSFSPRSANGG